MPHETRSKICSIQHYSLQWFLTSSESFDRFSQLYRNLGFCFLSKLHNFSKFLTKEDKKKLEFEVVPDDLMVYLTRILRDRILERSNEDAQPIIWQNFIVNMSQNLQEKTIYVLTADDWGMYPVYEQIWHDGELELVFRRLNTLQFIELICELIKREWFNSEEVNQLFNEANLSFEIVDTEELSDGYFKRLDQLQIRVLSVSDIEDSDDEDTHPNIRLLVDRMDTLLENNDPAGVLHTSATIFETLAKDIIKSPTIENQPLGGFFEKYRKQSKLPKSILDYILAIYKSRNVTSLAGHGQTTAPQITKEEAILLVSMTKAFVKIEYQLHREALQVSPPDNKS